MKTSNGQGGNKQGPRVVCTKEVNGGPPLTAAETRLIRAYRSCNCEVQSMILAVAERSAARAATTCKPALRLVAGGAA